jgi:membrane-associated protease RseP (regulator of RpoE activity)
MRSIPLLTLLCFSATPALTAQEQGPPPHPDTPETIRLERGFPPGDFMPDGSVRILTTRRARLGIFFSIRARDTDSIGALVNRVTPNGPAARAGLQSGDIITRFNGTTLAAETVKIGRDQSRPGVALTMLAAGINPGDTVAIEYRRGKDRRNASVVAGNEPFFTTWTSPDGGIGYAWSDSAGTLGAGMRDFPGMPLGSDSFRFRLDTMRVRERFRMPPPMMFMIGTPLENLELAPLNRDLGKYFGTSEGILVISVPSDSPLGLKAGDVVFAVDGRVPVSPAHLLHILRSYERGEPIRLEIMRMKKRETITGSLGERP